jgi:hypothetical protein
MDSRQCSSASVYTCVSSNSKYNTLSPETVHAAVHMLQRGALRREILTALRQARKTCKLRSRGTDRQKQHPNMTQIADSRSPWRCSRTLRHALHLQLETAN